MTDTHRLTPREKVALKPCPFCGGRAEMSRYSGNPVLWCETDGCFAMMGGEEYYGTEDELVSSWNRRTALASGSGDHAELAEESGDDCNTCDGAGEVEARIGFGTDYVPCPECVSRESCVEKKALLAENAALRMAVEIRDGHINRLIDQATEAERKLAEAVGVVEWYGENARLARLIHSEGDAGRNALADDGGKRARTFLSKEAERG